MLGSLFERCIKRRAIKDTDPYDWEKGELPSSAQSEAMSMTQAQTKNERQMSADDAIPVVNPRRKSVSEIEQKPRKMESESPAASNPPVEIVRFSVFALKEKKII